MKQKKPYPSLVCMSCGIRYGLRAPSNGATWHRAKCGLCGKFLAVTEPRDFGHLQLDEEKGAKK